MSRRRQSEVDALEVRRLLATFTVTNGNDAGAGSIRAAITGANGAAGADTIVFAIPGNPSQVAVTLASPLPDLTGPVTIDGSTQAGYVVGAPVIKIRGQNLSNANGLTITNGASNSVIKGLAISGFKRAVLNDPTMGNAIVAAGSRFLIAECDLGENTGNDSSGLRVTAGGGEVRLSRFAQNPIGVTIAGTSADNTEIVAAQFISGASQIGISIGDGADGTRIGDGTIGGRNFFAGSGSAGVSIQANITMPNGTVIAGNVFGRFMNGNVAANAYGIFMAGASNSRIGGSTAGEANFFTHHAVAHLLAQGTNSTGTTIVGNRFGMNIDGTLLAGSPTPNGVVIAGGATAAIGGPLAGERNFFTADPAVATSRGLDVTSGASATIRNNAFGLGPAGTALGMLTDGLRLFEANGIGVGGTGPNDGNYFANYGNAGVHVSGNSGGHLIYGNRFGFNADGTTAAGGAFGSGVIVRGASGATIGGAGAGQANYFVGSSASFSMGVTVYDNAGAQMRGNRFGFDASGNRVGTMGNAIFIGESAMANATFVGGINAGEGNVIAGTKRAIVLEAAAHVIGNQIGLNAAGTSLDNGPIDEGITADDGATIANNVIAQGLVHAIRVDSNGIVRGNRIGTTADGLTVVGSPGVGIVVDGGGTQVGGAGVGEGNLIGRASSAGIRVSSLPAGGAAVTVRGNRIGMNAAGVPIPLMSISVGINVLRDGTIIGGSEANAGNVICRASSGIGGSASNVIVAGNTFGTPDGLGANHVNVNATFNNSTIGGDVAGAANTIYGGVKGVNLPAGASNTTIRRTHYFGSGLAIDLNGDGTTANDLDDADAGANTAQNFPVLLSADASNGANTVVTGSFNSSSNTPAVIDFYAGPNPASNTTYLGSLTVLTNGAGTASFNLNLPLVAAGQFLTATATHLLASPLGNTSELSSPIVIAGDSTPPTALASFEFETRQAVNVVFSENVQGSLSTLDLVLTNMTTNVAVPAQNVSYNVATNTASFLFASTLPDGNYAATIPAGAVTDPSGNASVASTAFFHVLAGDANRDKKVNFDDLLILASNYNTTGRTLSQGNFSYDAVGTVNFDDLLILAANYNTSIAAFPVPIAAPGKSPDNTASDDENDVLA